MRSVIEAKRLSALLVRWGPALALMVAIFLTSSIPSGEVPNLGRLDVLLKKTGHFIAYAFLALSFSRGIGQDKPYAYLLAWLLTLMYGASDEYHQLFTPGRFSSWIDWTIDSVGATVALVLRWFYRR